ncbi:hypothetical protein [Jiella marina]|uniref:hypothetical protein n=1 Tax=Jiella sp. LLJ827 TaxID=2917712 RepID=UPI00210179A4|nr:hypothetical protein [Jiella sp. LLJ827]MCQ0990621.1 hypothetical protein [Jiella sp. LLJ827]
MPINSKIAVLFGALAFSASYPNLTFGASPSDYSIEIAQSGFCGAPRVSTRIEKAGTYNKLVVIVDNTGCPRTVTVKMDVGGNIPMIISVSGNEIGRNYCNMSFDGCRYAGNYTYNYI